MAEKAVFIIDGVDVLPYIEEEGIEYKRNDIEAEGSGRTTMDGLMHRGRIAAKDELSVTCRPLSQADTQRVLNAIYPEFVTVTYIHPRRGRVTQVMYSNNVPATCVRIQEDDTPLWKGIKFPLIER